MTEEKNPPAPVDEESTPAETSRKFNLIPDKFKQTVTQIFGLRPETKAAAARRDATIAAHGDSFNVAMTAAFARQMRHNIRASYRRNSKGLPIGVSRHEYDSAKALEKLMSERGEDDEFVILDGRVVTEVSTTRINDADDVLQRVKSNREMRDKTWKRRGTKMQRRAQPHRRSKTLKEICAAHTQRLRENKELGRVPYVRPEPKFKSVNPLLEQVATRIVDRNWNDIQGILPS